MCRKLFYLTIVLLIISLLTTAEAVFTFTNYSVESNSVVYYFYIYGSYGCPHCRAMKDILVRNYGGEHVYFCSIDSEGENRSLFIELVNKGFPASIPITFIIYNYTVSAVIIGEYSNINFINSLLRTNTERKVPIYSVAARDVTLYKYLVIESSHRDFILKYLYWDKYLGGESREGIVAEFKLVSPPIDSATLLLTVLPALVIYSLLDSINPCVMVMYFSLVASSVSGRRKSIGPPIVFLIIIYIGYLLFALGLLVLTTIIPGKLLLVLAFLMGVYTVIRAGREKTLDFKCTWCEKVSFLGKIMSSRYLFSVVLALISVIILLPCTSGPLSGFIGLLRNYIENPSGEYLVAVPVFLLYNVLFILPLIIIFISVVFMGREKRVAKWLRENGAVVEFLIGIVLAMFSLILLLST